MAVAIISLISIHKFFDSLSSNAHLFVSVSPRTMIFQPDLPSPRSMLKSNSIATRTAITIISEAISPTLTPVIGLMCFDS